MKKSLIFLGAISICLAMNISCNTNKTDEKENTSEQRKSLWTDSVKNEFIEKNSKTDFDKFAISELISQNEFEKTEVQLNDLIKSQPDFIKDYKISKTKNYVVPIDDLAGKSKTDIEKILAEPTKKEKVNPSKTPCPCDKFTYLNDLVEIVYINGKADWITVNNSSKYAKVANSNSYVSVNRFDDYTYVKVSTK